jgi:VWFA-related protein
MTFTERISRASPWQSDRGPVRETIDRLRADGTTSLFDAASAALLQRDPEAGRRNLVILFTDGADTASWLPDAAALDLARRTDAVVYCVAFDREGDPGLSLKYRSGIRIAPHQPIISSADFLAELSSRTGGESLGTTVPTLRKVFQRIVQDFRTRYVLTYVPRGVPESGWHPIDIQIKGRRAHVTARRGYQR